jgi:hypothetical protein
VRSSGATALNIRVHLPGLPADLVHRQIVRLGDEVVPALKALLRRDRAGRPGPPA